MLDKNVEQIVKEFLFNSREAVQSNERLSNTFERFYDGIWIVNNKRNIIYANSVIINRLDCAPDELSDKNFLDFIFKEDQQNAIDIMQKPTSDKSLHKFRLRGIDGTEIFIKCYIKAFYNESEYAGSVIIFRDDLEK